jgi:hypothetical protein
MHSPYIIKFITISYPMSIIENDALFNDPSVSRTIFLGETSKMTFHIPRKRLLPKRKHDKEAVGSALRLRQYCQLLDKILAIFRDIYIFCCISKLLCICSSISLGTANYILCDNGVRRNLSGNH